MPRLLLALWRLLLPFVVLMIVWGFVVDEILEWSGLRRPVLDNAWKTMGFGGILVMLCLVGLILQWNLAALVYRLTRGPPRMTVHAPAAPRPGAGPLLARYQRIGIILAGGGAKGAYQAGAMRAIWEFLEEHSALDRVRMIAGTSIGAWNAMFWMAGLVRPPGAGDVSAHEAWWRAVKPERILDFDWYIPFFRNHLARPTPWRQGFRRLFVEDAAIRGQLERLLRVRPASQDPAAARQGPLHFYLTRSNVKHALLEFTTNSWGMADLQRTDALTGERVPVVKPALYEVLDGGKPDQALRELEDAVFASMDIPPVFPYVGMKDEAGAQEWFEDGGVIENLPLFFGTAIEQCDLLFVLPLNASFDADVNHRSIMARLSRVMEARQGVIERNAFKQAYLYNNLAEFTKKPQVNVFAICPAGTLDVGTIDFHKPRAAGAAYRLMYEQTARVLRQDVPTLRPDWIRLATVAIDPATNQPQIDYVDEF